MMAPGHWRGLEMGVQVLVLVPWGWCWESALVTAGTVACVSVNADLLLASRPRGLCRC